MMPSLVKPMAAYDDARLAVRHAIAELFPVYTVVRTDWSPPLYAIVAFGYHHDVKELWCTLSGGVPTNLPIDRISPVPDPADWPDWVATEIAYMRKLREETTSLQRAMEVERERIRDEKSGTRQL